MSKICTIILRSCASLDGLLTPSFLWSFCSSNSNLANLHNTVCLLNVVVYMLHVLWQNRLYVSIFMQQYWESHKNNLTHCYTFIKPAIDVLGLLN